MEQHGDTDCNISGRRSRILASILVITADSSERTEIRHNTMTHMSSSSTNQGRLRQLQRDPSLQGHGQLTLTDVKGKS